MSSMSSNIIKNEEIITSVVEFLDGKRRGLFTFQLTKEAATRAKARAHEVIRQGRKVLSEESLLKANIDLLKETRKKYQSKSDGISTSFVGGAAWISDNVPRSNEYIQLDLQITSSRRSLVVEINQYNDLVGHFINDPDWIWRQDNKPRYVSIDSENLSGDKAYIASESDVQKLNTIRFLANEISRIEKKYAEKYADAMELMSKSFVSEVNMMLPISYALQITLYKMPRSPERDICFEAMRSLNKFFGLCLVIEGEDPSIKQKRYSDNDFLNSVKEFSDARAKLIQHFSELVRNEKSST
jgi:hypothetical protein